MKYAATILVIIGLVSGLTPLKAQHETEFEDWLLVLATLGDFGDLYRFNPLTQEIIQMSHAQFRVPGSGGCQSQVSNKIAYVDSGVFITNGISTLEVVPPFKASVDDVGWEPDGTQLLMSGRFRDFEPGTNLFTLDLKTGPITQITDSNFNSAPVWSPLSDEIAYVSYNKNVGYRLVVTNQDGTDTRVLYESERYIGYPGWSPDGLWLVFTSDHNIYVIRPDGTRLKQLTQNSMYNITPVWSPDGQHITFSASERDNARFASFQVYTMKMDGSDVQPLVIPPFEIGSVEVQCWMRVPTQPEPEPTTLDSFLISEFCHHACFLSIEPDVPTLAGVSRVLDHAGLTYEGVLGDYGAKAYSINVNGSMYPFNRVDMFMDEASGVVTHIWLQIDELPFQDVVDMFGLPEDIRTNADTTEPEFYLLYPSQGIAFVSNQTSTTRDSVSFVQLMASNNMMALYGEDAALFSLPTCDYEAICTLATATPTPK